MRMPSAPTFTIAAGLAAMALAFFSNAGAQDQTLAETAPKRLSSAILRAGVSGALSLISTRLMA